MDHEYLSTACLHGEHSYCKGEQGMMGKKKPAECKFCGSHCICQCHRENVERPPNQSA